jgi:hypothetical protein
METRILANIKDKKKKRFPIKAIISSALAVAVVVGCVGGAYYKNNNDDNNVTYVDRPFSVMVVNASDDMNITEEISENAVKVPDLYMLYNSDDTVEMSSKTGFYVDGDDIDYVQYKCENGELVYLESAKLFYDIENQNYYNVIIPVPDSDLDEVNKLIDSSYINPEEYALKEYAKSHDLSQYFDDKDYDLNDYQVEFDKCSDIGYPENNDGYAFYLVVSDWGDSYYQSTDYIDEVTVRNYELSENTLKNFTDDEIIDMYSADYIPTDAASVLLDNPDIDMSELPTDEITIIVTFKDGTKAKKIVTVSFDDDGYAQFAFK